MTTGPLTVLVLPDSEPVEKRRKRTVNAATWWTATYWKDLISLGIGSEQAHVLRLLALETGSESHLRWHVDHSRTCMCVFPKAHNFCCIFINEESIYALRYCLLSLENYSLPTVLDTASLLDTKGREHGNFQYLGLFFLCQNTGTM